MNLRTTVAGKAYYYVIELLYRKIFKDRNLSPSFFTFCGLGFAILVPFGFLISPVFASLLILISGMFDSIDGYVARNKDQQTKFGAFLDSVIDRISDFFYLCGFWVFFWENSFQHKALFDILIAISILFTLLISYTKARIEGLRGQCDKGFMSRAIRVIYLLLWGITLFLFPDQAFLIIWIGIFVYLFLTIFTVIQRILYALSSL